MLALGVVMVDSVQDWRVKPMQAHPRLFGRPTQRVATPTSACTCEHCAKLGRLFNRGGWFMTACDEHGKGEPVAERRDFEKVHVVYRIVDGEPVPCGRRYDRSTDSFVYIRPGSLQNEEE